MDAFEIHEILHRQAKIGAEFKPPVDPNIDFQKLGNDLNQAVGTPPPVNNIAKPIPWRKILVWGGAITGGIILIREIWKNKDYISNHRKRRLQLD